jgi:hypothetical protein
MTISNQDARTGPYNGNGSTTSFAYDFKVIDEDHLVVTLKDSSDVETVQTITTNYTVTGVGAAGGGTVEMVTAPASGETLTISRAVPLTQEVDLANRGGVQPEVLETAYDKLTQALQDQEELHSRVPRFPVSSALTNVELPLTLVANTALVVNAGGTGYTTGPTAAAISGAAAEAAAAAASATASANSATASDNSATASASSAADAAASAASIGLTTRGDLLTRGASANERLAIGGADTVLLTDGTDPAWGQVSLTAGVTGTLPLANGGTGATVAATALSNLGGISPSATSNLTAGFTTDLNAIGNSGTGTQTVSLTLECLQTLTINGSFTLAPPASGNGIAIIYATNDGTGGYTMTTSGFTKVTGTYNSTAAAVNRLQVEKVGALTTLIVTDLTP